MVRDKKIQRSLAPGAHAHGQAGLDGQQQGFVAGLGSGRVAVDEKGRIRGGPVAAGQQAHLQTPFVQGTGQGDDQWRLARATHHHVAHHHHGRAACGSVFDLCGPSAGQGCHQPGQRQQERGQQPGQQAVGATGLVEPDPQQPGFQPAAQPLGLQGATRPMGAPEMQRPVTGPTASSWWRSSRVADRRCGRFP